MSPYRKDQLKSISNLASDRISQGNFNGSQLILLSSYRIFKSLPKSNTYIWLHLKKGVSTSNNVGGTSSSVQARNRTSVGSNPSDTGADSRRFNSNPDSKIVRVLLTLETGPRLRPQIWVLLRNLLYSIFIVRIGIWQFLALVFERT